MASERNEIGVEIKLRKFNDDHYLESEINEANDILDLIKETRLKIDKTKRLLTILNEVENYGYLDLEDAKFLTNKIKSVLDKSQNKIQYLIVNNPKIYLALDLLARSGYGDLVIGLFSDDLQFTATNNENL